MQRSVTAYFSTRKRQATDELRRKAKVLLLEQESRTANNRAQPSSNSADSESPASDQGKMGLSPRMIPHPERSATVNSAKKVLFEKKGALSPKKPALPMSPRKETQSNSECTTPKKTSTMDRLVRQDLTLDEIKNRINKSSRLAELKASVARIKNYDRQLSKLQKEISPVKPRIRRFDNIELEIPVSPTKACKSPSKALSSPVKGRQLSNTASPQRRLLFEPKEAPPSPIKGSPTKTPAYQKYLSLTESGVPALPLPYKYRFLAEAFRCMDTVSAMLFNRKEAITFKKLKPAVQEMLRRNFTLEHLAQIKTVYPNAYEYRQEKHHSFGSASKQDRYELILIPVVERNNEKSSTDRNDGQKSEEIMGPAVLLQRRRAFYQTLLERVKDEHEKFLHGLDPPMEIPKGKIMRWHPEFDVETSTDIEQSELPQPPTTDKSSSAKDVLEKARSLYSSSSKRMEKSLQKMSETITTTESRCSQTVLTTETTTPTSEDGMRKVQISLVDTPPATPTTQSNYLASAFKGIPKALLEKVRAKQAAKTLEAMTRTPTADKEATLYSRLPELAKILRNIFVAEKKGVLTLEFVISKLDNSFRTKLTPNELEELVRLLCKLLPTWASVHNVRKVNYLKLARDVDLNKVVKRLQILANDKVTAP